MPLFELPPVRADKGTDALIVSKARKSKKTPTTIKGGGGITTRVANIKAMVLKHLGQYENETLLIRDESVLSEYIAKVVEYGEVAIDTETNGLDPMLDDCVGISMYFPGEKTVYIPINHVSYMTMTKVDNQLSKEVVAKYLRMLTGECIPYAKKVKVIMFNAVFDIRVILNQIGVRLPCYWDCSIASRLLNENEKYEMTGKVGLKKLHQKYVLNGASDAFSFDDLFKDIKFSLVPINVGYLYAGHDAKITYEYYEFQKVYLYYNPTCALDDRDGLNGVSYTFFNIEMPIVDVVVDMEDTGVSLDIAYARELSIKYHKKEEEALTHFYDVLSEYTNAISKYKAKHPDCKLDDPIKVSSPAQLAVLFYDILGCVSNDKKKPRGTGTKILKSFNLPIADAILQYRGITKLLTTYIDKLPECLNPIDNRLHCKFNQYGADTGRFSSSNPNLQNIPSHNRDIRPMFTASIGYVMLSSDYSQQEPSCLAAFCRQMGYTALFDARFKGNDLYSEVASACFNLPYEECLEHFPKGAAIVMHDDGAWYYAAEENKVGVKIADGETDVYKVGKSRRNMAKPVLLGILYGRGDDSVAEGMGITVEEAKQLKANLFKKFPEIAQFEQASLQMARECGYVTTVCGRKRRLPDLQLPEYSFAWEQGFEPAGDILDFELLEIEVPYSKQTSYLKRLANARGYKNRYAIIEQAKAEHIDITDNSRKIGDATRQCVNARIQGSAADLTKVAMIELYANERLKDLGFRMLIPVHDEIIAECPRENAEECAKLLAEVMSHAAEEILGMPFSCDVECSDAWYGNEIDWYHEEEEDDDE